MPPRHVTARLPAGRRKALRRKALRRGATVVEMALIGPLVLLLLIGLVVLELGVFQFNQVTALAQEGARWASVRGPRMDAVLERASPVTAEDLYREIIAPRAAGLDPKKLDYELQWGADRRTVTVVVRYQSIPAAYFGQRIISSSATAIVSN